MNEVLPCPECGETYDAMQLLEFCTISWPELNWLYFHCPNCKKYTHILVEQKRMSSVKFLGAPGPSWEIIKSICVPNLEIRMDPKFAHVWLNGKHYEFTAKE